MDFSALGKIYFEALNYPEMTRPGFFIKKQQESGWDKGTFLNSLLLLYHDYEMIFSIHHSSQRRRNPNLTKEETTIILKEMIDDESGKSVSFKEVQDIYLTVLAAFEIGKPVKIYTNEEVLSFVEYALWFILKEFKIQTNEIEDRGFRPRTKTYFVYELVEDGPFFNFPQFKKTVRAILLSLQNSVTLKHLFQKYYDAAVEIVALWNNKLSKLEREANTDQKEIPPEIVKVEFKAQELKHSWWNDVPEFTIKKHEFFLNQDFASYAAQIANLLASEVLNYPEVSLNPEKNFIADICLGIHNLLYIGGNADSIRDLRQGRKNESSFRYYFFTWFNAKGYLVDAESQKDNGFIDLKVRENDITHIIEFKGWWNQDKAAIIKQTCNYLTTFEGEAYIFMINDSKKNVIEKYKGLVTDRKAGYMKGTWEELRFKETAFYYFKSRHQSGAHEKYIYHFIISPNT